MMRSPRPSYGQVNSDYGGDALNYGRLGPLTGGQTRHDSHNWGSEISVH